MSIDEELGFIGKDLLDGNFVTNDSELLNESNMTDEQCFQISPFSITKQLTNYITQD